MGTLIEQGSNIGPPRGINFLPALAPMPDGSVWLFWQHGTDAGNGEANMEAVLNYSTFVGSSWSAPAEFPNCGVGVNSPSTFVDGSRVYLFWIAWASAYAGTAKLRMSYTDDSGATWSTPVDFAADVTTNFWAVILNGITMSNGDRILCGHYGDGRLQISKCPSGDDATVAANWDHYSSDVYGLAVEPTIIEIAGNKVLMLARADGSTNEHLLQRVFDNAANTWGAGSVTAIDSLDCPAMVIRDGQGALWLFHDNTTTSPRLPLVYRRSLDDGTTWGAATTISASNAQYPSAAVASDGTIWCAWSADKQDVYVQSFPAPEPEPEPEPDSITPWYRGSGTWNGYEARFRSGSAWLTCTVKLRDDGEWT